jgi:ribosomal protein L37AE/L43A
VANSSGTDERLRFAPKVPVAWIVQLYRRDVLGLADEELMDKVGGRLYARCLDVIAVSKSRVQCPVCRAEFEVPWIGGSPTRVASCAGCGFTISAGAFHTSFEHQDLYGANGLDAFERFVAEYREANGYAHRMIAVDRLVHALHVSGNTVVRNLVEGRPREVLGILDDIAWRR